MIKMNMYSAICDKHDEIYDLAREIINLDHTQYSDIADYIYKVQNFADDILTFAKAAKDDGIKMENRMREYREAIEGLGFERKR